MTRLIVDDPELAEAIADLAELIRPNITATIGDWLVCVTPLMGREQ